MSDERSTTAPKLPDLQEWVARYGGYPNIPWDKWDVPVADFERERRATIRGEIDESRSRK